MPYRREFPATARIYAFQLKTIMCRGYELSVGSCDRGGGSTWRTSFKSSAARSTAMTMPRRTAQHAHVRLPRVRLGQPGAHTARNHCAPERSAELEPMIVQPIPAYDYRKSITIRMCARKYHSYTHLIPALSIVRESTVLVWGFNAYMTLSRLPITALICTVKTLKLKILHRSVLK